MGRLVVRIWVTVWLLLAVAAGSALAQSQAVNGTIEGVVTDQSGAELPGVNVTVSNIDSGDTRVVVTNSSGVYRAPLLPLGRNQVSAEQVGFTFAF